MRVNKWADNPFIICNSSMTIKGLIVLCRTRKIYN